MEPRRVTSHLIALTVVGAIALAAASAAAQTGTQKPTAPKSAAPKPDLLAAQIAKGHSLFVSNCAVCHGANAMGDDGPSLHRKQLADAFVTSTIHTGIKDEMPPFASKLKPADVKLIVAYVHSLQK